jgi:hypothetical protein
MDMKPVYKVASLILAIIFMLSAVPQALLESAPGSAEKSVIEVSPLPGGILRSPGTKDWKIPANGAAAKGITPYPASAHPYSNNMDVYYSYQEPDAIGYIVTFSASTFVETGYDFIYFFDGDRNQLNFNIGGDVFYRFTGNQLAGRTMMIESPQFFTNLVSDDSNTAYGFSYTSIIPVYTPSNTSTVIYTCEQSGPGSAKLVWNKLNGADGYLVYRGTGGSASQVADVTDTNLQDPLPAGCEGVTYYYKVQPYYMDGLNQNLYTASEEKSVTIMAVPEIVKAFAINATTAFIDWKTVPGADGYSLYRSALPAGPYSWIKTVTSSEAVGSTGGANCYYKVRPFRTYSTKISGTLSPASGLVSYTALTLDTVQQSGETSAKIKWSPVAGATGYVLYRNLTLSGTYTAIKTMEGLTPSAGKLSTTNSSLSLGKRYYYKIRAYTTVDGVKYYGAYTPVKSEIILNRPEMISAQWTSNAKTTALIKWNAVTGADGYRLYRAASAAGTYSLIKNIIGIQTTNIVPTPGKTYYYKVAAYHQYVDKVTGAQSYYKKLT